MLLNRRGNYFQDRYPELKEIWKNIKAKKVILDAELVVFEKGKPSFYRLAEREHVEEKVRIELLSEIIPSTLIVFDIIYKDGVSLIELPLIERKKILEKTVEESDRILLSQYVIGKGKKFFQEVKKKGLEGVMGKRVKSTYQLNTRSKDWLKIKYLKTLDCVICGYTVGTGWRKKYFGALILGCYYQSKLRYIGRVGTGLEERGYAELTEALQKLKTDECPFEEKPKMPFNITAIWVKPKLVCEIKFMNLSKDLIPRAPSFVRLREDKLPEECILEVS